jgi:hypothetical protein
MGNSDFDIGRFEGFITVVRKLSEIFATADQPALEQALRSDDLSGACIALHISENSLTALLSQGGAEAAKIAKEEPQIASLKLIDERLFGYFAFAWARRLAQ